MQLRLISRWRGDSDDYCIICSDMSKSHVSLCEEAVFGKFVSVKAIEAFISYVDNKGRWRGAIS